MADRDSSGLALPIQGATDRASIASTATAIHAPTNGATPDPFTTPTQPPHQRFAQYDHQTFSASMSPSQARRTLQVHLAETERRIKEASQLGTSLVQQQSNLTSQLKDLQDKKEDGEIGEEVRQKLANIEKEYNELGAESARAFLAPRSRVVSSETGPVDAASPAMFSSQALNSPSKLSVPSRKQRNQPSSRAHDIEFAAEIGTSLLSQVRQLQALLAEREDALKSANMQKSKLEIEAKSLTQRLRAMDESEQRFKDENWNLETHTHELMASAKESTEREEKLGNTLKALTVEKTSVQKELDELKQSHGKLTDDHTTITKHYEAEISGLRRNIVFADSEKAALQRRLDEAIAQNEELAKAAAIARSQPQYFDDVKDLEGVDGDVLPDVTTPDGSPPPSPTKGTPRHTMLESETLKSSLHHSHRMIQTLKGNLHREKAEKIELRRMLQETKDELEIRRGQNGVVGAAKKNRASTADKDGFKKPAKPGMLGAGRSDTREILMDEEGWEDHAGQNSPTRKPRNQVGSTDSTNDTSDAFETANERGDTTTENEAFETGAESLAGDSSDELTETEDATKKAFTARDARPSTLIAAKNRESYLSTASTSNDEAEVPEKATKQPFLQRLKLKVNRGGSIRHQRAMNESSSLNSTPSSIKNSPASIANSSPTGPPGQSLFAEIGDFEDEMDDQDGTPSKRSILSHGSRPSTAARARPSPLVVAQKRVEMKDSGMMTEPSASPSAPGKAPGGLGLAATGIAAGTAAVSGAVAAAVFGSGEKEKADVGANRPKSLPQPDSPTIPDSNDPAPLVLSTSRSPMTQSFTSAKPSTPEQKSQQQPCMLSAIHSEDIEPITPKGFSPTAASGKSAVGVLPVPIPSTPTRQIASTDKDMSAEETKETQQPEQPKTGILGSVFGWGSDPSQSSEDPSGQSREVASAKAGKPQPLGVVSGNATPKKPVIPMTDQSSQTMLSSSQIGQMLKSHSTAGVPTVLPLDLSKGQQNPQWRLSTGELNPDSLRQRKSQESISGGSVSRARSKLAEANMSRDEGATLKTHKRPTSSSSQRSSTGTHPPLPPDHRQAIAAAAQKGPVAEVSSSSMGPPPLPISAYRSSSQVRPRTPSSQFSAQPPTSPSQRNLHPRASNKVYYSSRASDAGTHRSSVTSFASELDERFNIRTDGLPAHSGFEPGTDPRMIQAITQTMIGEYLWKYTRRAGRGEMSTNRHRRFFWVHPYTRTLYWSDRDPASAGRAQLKAKSVAIQAVRVVTDDNPMPPGLHRKSLVVMTPGRDVKFTATTGQRHETWFNALSYLLLRTGSNGAPAGDYTAEELDEFNPSLLPRGRGTASLRSFASRNTRRSDATGVSQTPTQIRNTDRSSQPHQAPREQQGGSISRLSNYFVPSSMRGSFSSRRSRHSQAGVVAGQGSVYESSELHDSAEDVREAIERGEGEDGLENVRACCDGKHDVGHLSSRRSRTSGISDHHLHHHHHHGPANNSVSAGKASAQPQPPHQHAELSAQ
ncbi:MAG: hypothetical protein M1814_001958 [Vezdaea aestivalis]|nr:MAG: hypothetical protein M1814_001958 [Vezdaea aestivalis]